MSTTPSTYVFDQRGTTRIVAAVRKTEGQPLDVTDQPTPSNSGSSNEVWVTITSNLGGIGKYSGKIVLPPESDISDSSDVSLADFGTSHTPEYGTCKIINATEIGETEHALAAGKVYRGRILRRQSDGTVWVGVESVGFDGCNPSGFPGASSSAPDSGSVPPVSE